MLPEKSSPEGASPLDRLNDPNVEIHYTIPRPAEYKTGLLKSAYLAACLHFGCVVHSQSMKQLATSSCRRGTQAHVAMSNLDRLRRACGRIELVSRPTARRWLSFVLTTKARAPI